MLPRAPSLQTLGLMVKNTIHKTKKMSLRYFFNGAMPSEQTENNIKIAQVRLSSSSKRQPRLSCARACASWLRAGGGVELRGGAGVGERGHRGVRDEQDHAAGAEEDPALICSKCLSTMLAPLSTATFEESRSVV